jgi:molybdopterin converting factor small subunit
MKQHSLLIVGLGVPSELTDALVRSGYDITRAEEPLHAALAMMRGGIDVVLSVGDLDEAWNEFCDAASAATKFVAIESLVSLATTLASGSNGNGRGNGNGNGNGNGHGLVSADDLNEVGMSVQDVLDLIERRTTEPAGKADHIYTKVGNKLRKVPLEDILYIEVEGKYSALQVKDRKYNVKASLKDLLQKLPTEQFVRVSRNFVVNLNRIQHIDTFQYTVKVGDMEIPISRTYKEELMRHINLI